MAQRRMISKSISTSTKLAKVSTFACLLFTWIIPHCDDFGRIDGTAKIVRGIVVPLRDETVEDVEQAIKDLIRVGLINRYMVDDQQYIEISKWDEHQTLRSDRPLLALHPGNPEGYQGDTSGKQRGKISHSKLSEVKLSEEKIYLARFEEFWSVYPNKKAKKKAQDKWMKLKPDQDMFNKILIAVTTQAHSDQWVKDEGRFIPHPTTWLNGERWNDVLKVSKVGGKYETVKSTNA